MRHLAALGLILSFSGCYALQSSSDYYGIDSKAAGQGVVFVVDVSGSMEGKQEGNLQDMARGAAANTAGNAVQNAVGGRVGRLLGGQVRGEATKLGGAKRELIPVLRGLDPSSRFTVLTFGGNIDTWRGGLVEASASNKNLASVHVNGLDANGGTPMQAALDEAFAIPGATVIFLMTDGEPTDASADQIRQRVRSMNSTNRMTLHTIGLGPDQDQTFLRALAAENGGQYVKRE